MRALGEDSLVFAAVAAGGIAAHWERRATRKVLGSLFALAVIRSSFCLPPHRRHSACF